MKQKSRILALIPARSGSQGLRHKNLQKIGGKPLLEHAIELALKSRRKHEAWTVCVSTDSPHYARIGRKAGAETPFLRPAHLATTRSPLWKTIRHALEYYEKEKQNHDLVLLLSPTTPLTQVKDVRLALDLHAKTNRAVASVVSLPGGESWLFRSNNNRLSSLGGTSVGRRQAQKPIYRINGAIYVATPIWLRKNRYFIADGQTEAYVMPPSRSLDIECAEDLSIAKLFWGTKKEICR